MATLAIDAGNTRIKWGLFDASGVMVEHGACLHAELAKLALPKANKVVISNVAGVAIAEQLKSLSHQHANIYWVKAQASACGVTNGYAKSETLGSDRWAALIAAWQLKQAPCVVVNAGTAVTVDALNAQGKFTGGLILPGLDLMQKSLGAATAQLPIQNVAKEKVEIFATNTTDAIFAGSVYAIAGAIELMHVELIKKDAVAPFILISGGNSAIIYNHVIKTYLMGNVTKQVFIVDNLVLQGLYLLEKNYAS